VLAPDRDAAATAGVELTDTPFFAQEAFQCGPAALATVLRSSGVDVSPPVLADQVYLPHRQGSLQAELVAATRRHDRLPYQPQPELAAIVDELQAGRPVLVLQNLGPWFAPQWHYAVVIGYLPAADALVLRSGTEARLEVSTARFLSSWRRADAWGLVVLRPGELPANPDHDRYLRTVAALEQVGRLEAARLGYAAAVRAWPENATAWLGLGNVAYGLERPVEAEAAFRQVLALAPRHVIARNNLAHVLAERGCYAAAFAHLDAAQRFEPPDTAVARQLQSTRDELAAAQQRFRSRADLTGYRPSPDAASGIAAAGCG
jgi:tetratricopeptide (TPR) repeat protein